VRFQDKRLADLEAQILDTATRSWRPATATRWPRSPPRWPGPSAVPRPCTVKIGRSSRTTWSSIENM